MTDSETRILIASLAEQGELAHAQFLQRETELLTIVLAVVEIIEQSGGVPPEVLEAARGTVALIPAQREHIASRARDVAGRLDALGRLDQDDCGDARAFVVGEQRVVEALQVSLAVLAAQMRVAALLTEANPC